MTTPNDPQRGRRGKTYLAAHIGGCIAAMTVMVVMVLAKIGGSLPANVTLPRLMIFPVLAYGLVVGAMLWKLGRSIKQSKGIDEEAGIETALPRQAG